MLADVVVPILELGEAGPGGGAAPEYNSALILGRDGHIVPSLAGNRAYRKYYPVLGVNPGMVHEDSKDTKLGQSV
jgi:hypothetical protein